MSWALGPLAAFDLETSGVDVENDRVVTACVVRIDPGEAPIVRGTANAPLPLHRERNRS